MLDIESHILAEKGEFKKNRKGVWTDKSYLLSGQYLSNHWFCYQMLSWINCWMWNWDWVYFAY